MSISVHLFTYVFIYFASLHIINVHTRNAHSLSLSVTGANKHERPLYKSYLPLPRMAQGGRRLVT